MEYYSEKKPWTREQRIGVVFLSFFAVFTIALGFLQIRNSMYAPFALNNDVSSNLADKMDEISALHYRDTDKDGLNDFDELYVYNTSRYLADTDSDGLTDKEEIDSGKDPLCAAGASCEKVNIDIPQSLEMLGLPKMPTSTVPKDADELISNFKDPKTIRTMLEASGMDKEMLKKIPDEELMTLVEGLLASTSTPL